MNCLKTRLAWKTFTHCTTQFTTPIYSTGIWLGGNDAMENYEMIVSYKPIEELHNGVHHSRSVYTEMAAL